MNITRSGNHRFTVTDTDDKLGGTFTRYGNYLYATTGSYKKMYALNTGTSIASANLNTGTDKITLNGAEDVVDETTLEGKDEITGYASGKDKLLVADGTKYVLSTTTANDVYVVDDDTNYIYIRILRLLGRDSHGLVKDNQ